MENSNSNARTRGRPVYLISRNRHCPLKSVWQQDWFNWGPMAMGIVSSNQRTSSMTVSPLQLRWLYHQLKWLPGLRSLASHHFQFAAQCLQHNGNRNPIWMQPEDCTVSPIASILLGVSF